jgi:hypothetical protein
MADNEDFVPRYLSDVQRMQLEPGDIVVVTVHRPITAATSQRIEQIVEDKTGYPVLVVDADVKLSVMARKTAEKLAEQHTEATALDRALNTDGAPR